MKTGLALLVFIGTVVGANWAVVTFGVVPVGFGLMAPAGVFFAGVAFTARDVLHDLSGRRMVLVGIVAGALLSGFLEDATRLAIGSGVAFFLSEIADLAIYTPLRKRTWLGSVAASNSVGLTVDSVLFLAIAFGSLAFLPGQLVGKAYMTIGAIVLMGGGRAVLSRYARTKLAGQDRRTTLCVTARPVQAQDVPKG